jgi:hypothetical protein
MLSGIIMIVSKYTLLMRSERPNSYLGKWFYCDHFYDKLYSRSGLTYTRYMRGEKLGYGRWHKWSIGSTRYNIRGAFDNLYRVRYKN